ncbi:MAG: bifunctional oligoribonuclease/PAP phosphatase NrnA [Treponema sp.]|jgi:phosphoesterase RecJ-like protein|nr:bifunctional oligoribonuclease/PAP phosphatase NrnA [Treponema sp.]
MQNTVFDFLKRQSSLILTTHDPPDADGIGAEMAFSQIAKSFGLPVRIVNSCPTPEKFAFMDNEKKIEIWVESKDSLDRKAGLVIFDTTDEYYIGEMRSLTQEISDVLVIDHHERNKFSHFEGYIDSTASSTCEMVIELAQKANVTLTVEQAKAAYAGLVYDSGFFAYSKTTPRTMKVATAMLELDVKPYEIYQYFHERSSTAALLLQKAAFFSLEIHNEGRVAIQVIRKEDLESTGASFEDSDNFANIPLQSKDIFVSVLVRESMEGHVRCSLRSKGTVSVSKIAQLLGGGGHISAAGFKSSQGIKETVDTVLSKINKEMNGAPL